MTLFVNGKHKPGYPSSGSIGHEELETISKRKKHGASKDALGGSTELGEMASARTYLTKLTGMSGSFIGLNMKKNPGGFLSSKLQANLESKPRKNSPQKAEKKLETSKEKKMTAFRNLISQKSKKKPKKSTTLANLNTQQSEKDTLHHSPQPKKGDSAYQIQTARQSHQSSIRQRFESREYGMRSKELTTNRDRMRSRRLGESSSGDLSSTFSKLTSNSKQMRATMTEDYRMKDSIVSRDLKKQFFRTKHMDTQVFDDVR